MRGLAKREVAALGAGLALALLGTPGLGATFTTNTVIDFGVGDYEGQDLIVSGCTLTVNGPHHFNSLVLTNAAVLTHTPAPNGENSYQLNLTIAQGMWVDGASRISGTGLGYGAGAGPGAGGASTYAGGGGGHGGVGGTGFGGAVGGWIYDDRLNPVQPGSGGGNGYFGFGGAGGGIVRLTVGGLLWLDGAALSADGGVGGGGLWGAGGGGGSIVLTVGTLGGFGLISANGGSAAATNLGGGGGGGCVSIYCATNLFRGSVTAFGGAGLQPGGAGSVLLKLASASVGDLRLDNGGIAGPPTPLNPLPLCNLIITNQAAAFPLAAMTNVNLLVQSNGLLLAATGQGLSVTVLSNALVDVGGQISVSGQGYTAAAGPGLGASSSSSGGGGAGHGGCGGDAGGGGGAAYGSILAPVEFGSGGGNGYDAVGGTGGGSVQLTVGGSLRVDGVLRADGNDGYGFGASYGGGGAGGSLYLTTRTLAGMGTMSANGGSSPSGGGGGAGGRIALYYDTNNFTGAILAYGGGGVRPGGAGTVFTKLSTAPRGLVLIHNGGNAGGITRLDNAFWPGSTYFDLTVAGGADMVPDMPLTFGNVVVTSGAVVSHDAGQTTLQIVALNDLLVDAGSSVSADGLGFAAEAGAGVGFSSGSGGGGGGAYGGAGGMGRNGGAGGLTNGSAFQPSDLGSGGGAGILTMGGAGGGAIRLSAGRIMQVIGAITANGAPNPNYSYGGGGSGGSIFLSAGVLSGAGAITANGGTASQGGGGGGGRIAIYGGLEVNLPTPPTALGALGGDGSDLLRNGQNGTVVSSTNLPPFQVYAMTPSGYSSHPISFVDLTFNAGVSSNTLPLAAVQVTTPSGLLPPSQISLLPLGGPVFRVSFPAQSAAGQYSVRIGPHVQDLYGREMDQNGNGIRGEADGDVFTGTFSLGPSVTLAGAVRLADGEPAGGVLVQTGFGVSALTDTNGTYALLLPQGWSGTVTPSKLGCTFSPASRFYASVGQSLTNETFTLTLAFGPQLAVLSQGNSFAVTWPSLAGIRYQIQTTTDLVRWTNTGPLLTGTGAPLYWVFDNRANARLYVRIVASD